MICGCPAVNLTIASRGSDRKSTPSESAAIRPRKIGEFRNNYPLQRALNLPLIKTQPCKYLTCQLIVARDSFLLNLAGDQASLRHGGQLTGRCS